MKGPSKDCGRICDPDETDLKRMFALYLDVPAGAQRDCVERAIAYICGKNPKASDRATILLGFVDRHQRKESERLPGGGSAAARTVGNGRCLPEDPAALELSNAGTLRRGGSGVLQLADRPVRRRALGLGYEVGVRNLSLPGVAGVYPRGDPPQRPAGGHKPSGC